MLRSEEHTSELQSHVSISYAVFCLKKADRLCELAMSIDKKAKADDLTAESEELEAMFDLLHETRDAYRSWRQ